MRNRLLLALPAILAVLLVAGAPAASADLLPPLPLPPLPLPTILPTPLQQPVQQVTGKVPVVGPVVAPLVGGGSGSAPSTGTGGDPQQQQPAASGSRPSPEEQAALPEEPQRRRLEDQQAAISDQAAGLDDQYGYDARAVGGGDGAFAWPIAFRGTHPPITQRFGCTDLAGEPYSASCASHRFHTGIDLGVPTGTPIRAAAPGVARTFRADGGYGNYVLVAHGNGWFTLYAHMSGFSVLDGQVVRRGEQLGQSGSTGFSTGPHLHFEIRHDQAFLDPCDYLNC